MVNVKAEYPEGHKAIYENPKPIHKEQDFIPEVKEKLSKIKWEEEPTVSCANKEVEIIALTSGIVAKIPVVIAALTVQINISSIIELSVSIFQIKEIFKKVYINECNLMQDTNTLFIKGFIKKDISYYTASSSRNNEIYGEVQSFAVEIPFKCTTQIKYNIVNPEEMLISTIKEFNYFFNNDSISNDIENDEKILEKVRYEEFNQIVTEYYNEVPYCEIVSSKIVETERLIESETNNKDSEQKKGTHAIESDGILNVTIQILQKRLVSIPKI